MKNKKYILFDLDGTISDNSAGIIGGVKHALEYYGLEIPDDKTLNCFIGPPLTDAFEKYCGFTPETSPDAVAKYREYFRETGIFQNEMYDGMTEVFTELKNSGKKLFIATSKPEEFANQIAKHFGIDGFFTFIGGATFDGTRGRKSDVIKYVIDKFGLDKKCTVMIGDRNHDILGAKEAGIDSIGVLYGFGDKRELEEAGADEIAETPRDIVRLLK